LLGRRLIFGVWQQVKDFHFLLPLAQLVRILAQVVYAFFNYFFLKYTGELCIIVVRRKRGSNYKNQLPTFDQSGE
jgi:hypothetical protein